MSQRPISFRIRVGVILDDSWSEWVGGGTLVRQPNGETHILTGPSDQAALHGRLAALQNFAIPVVGLDRLGEPAGKPPERPCEPRANPLQEATSTDHQQRRPELP